MDYSLLYEKDGNTVLEGARSFSLDDILDSGQCFRWKRRPDGSWEGIAFSRYCRVSQSGDTVTFHGVSPGEFSLYWKGYFDLGRDYGAVKELLGKDAAMAAAIGYAPGIRILRQEPWEALCTFVLSQNNNIPRIKGLVERLCGCFGEPVGGGFSFPRPERLASLEPEDLSPVRAGFRAKYILDCAGKVSSGELDLEEIASMPLADARAALCSVYGVGPKVADCALLYGFGRVECVPMDVWMKRIMASLYPGGFPGEAGPVAGIAQQYLFHYARNCREALAV